MWPILMYGFGGILNRRDRKTEFVVLFGANEEEKAATDTKKCTITHMELLAAATH